MRRKSTSSTTAYNVVCSLYKLGKIEAWNELINIEVAKWNKLFAENAKDSLWKWLIYKVPCRIHASLADMVFVAGMVYHFLFRKIYIEKQFEFATSRDGIRQVVVLGGGFDSFALRMSKKYHDIQFFEIDLSATQKKKLEIIKKSRENTPQNCHFIEADLANASLADTLKQHKDFNEDLHSFVVLEGVLMYMSEDEVKELFLSMRTLFKNTLTVVFGAIAKPDQSQHWQIRLVDFLLNKMGEGTKWYCPSKNMKLFMEKLGYHVIDSIDYKDLQRKYRAEADIQKIPDEDENYYTVAKIPL